MNSELESFTSDKYPNIFQIWIGEVLWIFATNGAIVGGICRSELMYSEYVGSAGITTYSTAVDKQIAERSARSYKTLDGQKFCTFLNDERYTCETCKGSKKQLCYCEDGKEECYDCDGSGKIDEKCEECDGYGEIENDCGDCDGSGTVREDCDECHGSGEIEEECPECEGRGHEDTEEEDECDKCHGSGEIEEECSNCDEGTLELDCNYCDGSGTHTDSCEECNEGDIEKDCETCEGSGKVECQDCDDDQKIECEDCAKDVGTIHIGDKSLGVNFDLIKSLSRKYFDQISIGPKENDPLILRSATRMALVMPYKISPYTYNNRKFYV